MLQNRRVFALAAALLLAFTALTAPLQAVASTGAQELLPKTISLDVRNADVRDVLSAVAVNMGKSIIYKGAEQRVTLRLADMPTMTAFDYILRLAGMTYLQDGNTLIVSTREVLTEDFARRLALTSLGLKYVSITEITQKIHQLGLPVTVISMEENASTLWVQGFPADIAKVRELVNVLDIPENEAGTGLTALGGKTLSYMKLRYIDPYDFNIFLRTLGIEYGLPVSSAGDRLYLFANAEERRVVSELKTKLDRENADLQLEDFSSFAVISFANISKETAVGAVTALYPSLNVVSVDNAAKAFFVSGKSEDISRATKLVAELDKVNNKDISTTFFAYDLDHITAAEAERRLDNIPFNDPVKFYVSTHAEFARTIFLYCNSDYEGQLRGLLQEIDTTAMTAYNIPIYIGTAAQVLEYQNYLNTMLPPTSGVTLNFATFTLGSQEILYLQTPNANTIALVEEMLERLSNIVSGDATIAGLDTSWAAFEASKGGGAIDQSVPANLQEYAEWILAQTGGRGRMGFSLPIGGLSAGLGGTMLTEPKASGQNYLDEIASEIDFFLENTLIAGEQTFMRDVIAALEARFSGVAFRDERLVSHILPGEDAEGSLEFTIIIEASDGAWREHRIALTLPRKHNG